MKAELQSDVVKKIIGADGRPYLFEILHGQFGRKDHEGNAVLLQQVLNPETKEWESPRFVPTPSELATDTYRLRRTDVQVDWDSDEALAVLHTINMRDPVCKGFLPEGIVQLTPEGETGVTTPGQAAMMSSIAVKRREEKAKHP